MRPNCVSIPGFPSRTAHIRISEPSPMSSSVKPSHSQKTSDRTTLVSSQTICAECSRAAKVPSHVLIEDVYTTLAEKLRCLISCFLLFDEKAVKNCGGVVSNPSDVSVLLPNGILSCNSNPFEAWLGAG